MRTTLLKNFSFLTASSVLMPIASMALVVAISRLGGVEMMGEYSLLLTFFFFGQTCCTAGLQILITREVARSRVKAGAYLVSGSAIGAIAATVISAILIPSFMWTVPGADVEIGLLLMAAALFPTVVVAFGESVLLAFEHAEDFVVIGFAETLIRATIGTLLVCLGYGIIAIALTFFLCRVAAAWATVHRMRRRDPELILTFDRDCFSELAHQVPIVGALPILNSLYWRLDTLILTWMRGLADVAYYSASTRILDITRNLPQAYARALYPILSRLRHEDEKEFERLSRDSLLWVVVATFPLSLTTCMLAPWIVTVLYGNAMRPAILGLQIVAWLMIPYALTSTLAQILFASGNQALDLRVNVIAVTVDTCLNLLFIRQWGFIGASIAVLISMTLHVSLQYHYVRQRVFDPAALATFARLTVVALASGLVSFGAYRYNPFLVTLVSLACYAFGLWAIGVVHRHHLVLAAKRTAAAIRFGSHRLARMRIPTS
ncbi:MAG: flippase [Deltaproteobacteria bacterium]|nr:flippase [Deltaproteobacteria bacterium]